MENILDLEEFERLCGPEFTRYVVRMKDIIIDDDFIKYFVKRKERWDDVHLELAVWWLGKSGLLAAHHEIVNFIDHPNRSVRFLAISFMIEMVCEVDVRIMSRVVEVLEGHPDPADRGNLNRVLTKPASQEAKAIVQQHLENFKSPP